MKRCFACFKEYDDVYQVCSHCGNIEIKKPKEPIHLAPGTVLANRYILGQAVGSGGFGIVYSAWDLKLETIVAVKEFFVSRLVTRAEGLKNLIITKKSIEEFEYRKERFLAEARNMAKFGSHRSIPNVFEFFEENNTAYIVMEMLHGVGLNEYLNQSGGKIDIDFALMIANEVGNALKSLHEENIVHRDVAPDNIYICSGKEIKIKLMDLGAAKLADSTDEVIDIILKPGYSPTEQYDNSKNIGPWTDIYALGATLYVMLTGIKPDESTNRKINDEVVPPHLVNPEVSENLSNAIMKAMAIEKHMRFKTINEFLSAINGEKKIIPLAKERKRRSFKRFAGVAIACLVLIIGSFFVYNTYQNKQNEHLLEPADIVVWFSVAEGSTEEDAMQAIKADFEQKYEGITVDVVAVPESEYEDRIRSAAKQGKLPTLFESSELPKDILSQAKDLDNVLDSEQFKNAMFLNQYNNYYDNKKQIPLAIEVPLAYVVTNGASCINYSNRYFNEIGDFNADNIAYDDRYHELLKANFGSVKFCEKEEFLNNSENTSPVLLSSTMILNEVRTTLTNYEKAYVYFNSDEIHCKYIYEWSIGDGESAEIEAAERLLSWMLGNVYQSYLMISECNDGQIPINAICFESKIQSKYLAAISDIHQKFVFEGKVEE